jgi:hypothetical protein
MSFYINVMIFLSPHNNIQSAIDAANWIHLQELWVKRKLFCRGDIDIDIAYGNVTAAAGPDDPSEGRLFWMKFITLFLCAVK